MYFEILFSKPADLQLRSKVKSSKLKSKRMNNFSWPWKLVLKVDSEV